jgi:hypothetical protein
MHNKKILSYLSKLKDYRKRTLPILSVLMLVVISAFFLSYNKGIAPIKNVSLLNTAALTGKEDFSEFPNVQKFEVANPKATVVYFPQIHKDPTTQPSDPKNNQASVAQKEIYNDLEKLNNKYGVSYVMDETDLYGPMPADKVTKIKNGFADIQTFQDSVNKTADHYLADGGSPDVANKFKDDASKAIAAYERNLYLTGSAAVLAAKEPKAHVYGSQVESTLNESKKELEDMVYLEQRINQLQGATASNPLMRSGGITMEQLSSALSNRNSSSLNSNMFGSISNFAKQKGDQELVSDLGDAQSKLGNLSTKKSFEAAPKFSDVPHTSNPYATSNNLNSLKAQYQVATQKFMTIAKDRRPW